MKRSRSFSAYCLKGLAPSDIVDALRSNDESDTGEKGADAVPFCIARHPIFLWDLRLVRARKLANTRLVHTFVGSATYGKFLAWMILWPFNKLLCLLCFCFCPQTHRCARKNSLFATRFVCPSKRGDMVAL